MSRIVYDSQGNPYVDETYRKGKESKEGKHFLTLYRDDSTDRHYAIVYTFNCGKPSVLTGLTNENVDFIRNQLISNYQNVFIEQYPPVVYNNLTRSGKDIRKIWGTTVYELNNNKPYMKLACIMGNDELDTSVQLTVKFLAENSRYGVDITDIYHNLIK